MTHPANDQSHPSNQSSIPADAQKTRESEEGTSIGLVIFLYFAAFFVVALLIAALLSNIGLRNRLIPFTETDWGTVKTVRYVSNFAPSTEVTTDRKTFLLRGTVNLDTDTRLIRRRDFFDHAICIDKTQVCWDLLGN